MTIHCNMTNQNDIFQQPFVSDKEGIEKMDRITQYLKDSDNSIGLKYSREESFENLEYIIECTEYISIMGYTGSSLQYMDKELQEDFNIVSEAVQWNELELQYASKKLQNDNCIIVTAAVRQNPVSFLLC